MSTEPTGHTAARLVSRVLAAPPTLATGRLLCIDGPAGSGKTTLAGAVLAAMPRGVTARVLHMDDLYEGWTGLRETFPRVAAGLVEPLRHGQPGCYRRYDWHLGAFAEQHRVDPVDVLVLEGVGSGARAWADAVTTLVWVEAPDDLRLQRGLARDGEALRRHWLAWMRLEAAVHAEEGTRSRADVVVDHAGGIVST